MKPAEDRILACCRVADGEPGCHSIVGTCADCGAAIWVALSSPKRITKRVCMHCLMRVVGSAPAVAFEPLTKRQLADMRRNRQDRGR